jgi:hypothetical protein
MMDCFLIVGGMICSIGGMAMLVFFNPIYFLF